MPIAVTIVLSVLWWLSLCGMFVAGCLWATRRPEPPPPTPPAPVFRRVARPCLVAPSPDGPVAIAGDYIAPRAAFGPTDRDVLDSLVLVDALMRGKW